MNYKITDENQVEIETYKMNENKCRIELTCLNKYAKHGYVAATLNKTQLIHLIGELEVIEIGLKHE